MAAKSSQSVLKQTLAPVILVVVFWLSMSGATTYYLMWVEQTNQRVFVENIVSARAAEALQIAVWKFVAEYFSDSESFLNLHQKWHDTRATIENERRELAPTANVAEIRAEVSNLEESLSQLFNYFDHRFDSQLDTDHDAESSQNVLGDRQHVMHLAKRIYASANSLCEFNRAAFDGFRLQRKQLNNFVLTARWIMLAIGPLFGVFLGLRIGLRIHRSIARISVTLHDANSVNDMAIEMVAIESLGDFHDVEQKAQQVAEKLRSVSRELHLARRELLQSERLAAVGELAAGVAHEIRNPLTSVKLLLQHASRQGSPPNLDEAKMQLILEEIGRMESTIQGLLDFSRPPKLNRVEHDLRQTLHRALNLLDARARQQGIEIALRISDAPLTIDGDTEKLHQLLVNLLINAVEAMPHGGCLSIDATLEVASCIPNVHGMLNDADRRMVQIVIRDTGEGIASDLLPRLFQPFATSKEWGTGLGLAVSMRIAEEHCGTIRACNGVHGAEFTFIIPSVGPKSNAHLV